MKLTFVAAKPPPSHIFEQIALAAAEENVEYYYRPPLFTVIDIAARPAIYYRHAQRADSSPRAGIHRLLKPHPPQEILESRVVPENIKYRIHGNIRHIGVMRFVGFLQPFEGLVFLPGTGIECPDLPRRNISCP
jgi:hypothetical protein